MACVVGQKGKYGGVGDADVLVAGGKWQVGGELGGAKSEMTFPLPALCMMCELSE